MSFWEPLKPLELLSVLINCFISPSFIWKGGDRTFPGCASGIFMILHSPGSDDLLGSQFHSKKSLSVAQLSWRHTKQQYFVKPDCILITFQWLLSFHLFSMNILYGSLGWTECAVGIEGFKFPLWRSTAFRLHLEESINKSHSEGSWFSNKHLKSASILLQKQSRPLTEKKI